MTLRTLAAVGLSLTAAHTHHRPGCAPSPHATPCTRHADAKYLEHLRRARRKREAEARKREAEMPEALASWYDDAGSTACGTHYAIGVAHKTLACGTRVRLCYAGRCEVAVVEDRGPFIAGRTFDLNPGAKVGIGCSDLCTVRYRVEG